MPQEKLGGGILLKNFRARHPKAPGYTSNEINLVCPHCREKVLLSMAMWEKQGKKGNFFAVSISEQYQGQGNGELPRESQQPQSDRVPSEPASETPPDDDVPF